MVNWMSAVAKGRKTPKNSGKTAPTTAHLGRVRFRAGAEIR